MGESTMKGFEFIGSSDAYDLTGRRYLMQAKSPNFIAVALAGFAVEGYDTSLYEYDLKLALTKHFSSCGEILQIHVPRNVEKGYILERYAFICIAGEGALEKALELSGSDVGGWRVFAKDSPYQEGYGYTDPRWAAERSKRFCSQREIFVSGYDTSLPKIDLQIGLSKYLSSCGEVVSVSILIWKALISIQGEGTAEKALELSGRDVDGWNITVDSVTPPKFSKKKFPTSNRGAPFMKAMIMKAKMMKNKKTTE